VFSKIKLRSGDEEERVGEEVLFEEDNNWSFMVKASWRKVDGSVVVEAISATTCKVPMTEKSDGECVFFPFPLSFLFFFFF